MRRARRPTKRLQVQTLNSRILDFKRTLVRILIDFLSGAEIVTVKQEAAFNAMERVVSLERDGRDTLAQIQTVDIEAALAKVRPRTKAKDIELFRQFARQHGQFIDDEDMESIEPL